MSSADFSRCVSGFCHLLVDSHGNCHACLGRFAATGSYSSILFRQIDIILDAEEDDLVKVWYLFLTPAVSSRLRMRHFLPAQNGSETTDWRGTLCKLYCTVLYCTVLTLCKLYTWHGDNMQVLHMELLRGELKHFRECQIEKNNGWLRESETVKWFCLHCIVWHFIRSVNTSPTLRIGIP